MQAYGLKNFISFMKNKDILTTAISFVIAGMMKVIIFKFTDEIILPLTEKKRIDVFQKVKPSEYLVLVINLVVVSYILFALTQVINDYVY